MLDKRNGSVSATIYTQKVSEQFRLDISKHNAQYPAIEVKEFKKSHDRFLILDNQVYLIGASLKDLGKKWFAVSLMSETDPDILLSRLWITVGPARVEDFCINGLLAHNTASYQTTAGVTHYSE